MCTALAMAELGSEAPTSGGLYFWTFMFSSPKWKHFLAWIVACTLQFLPNQPLLTIILTDCNTIANIAALASADWACAVQIMAAVSIGSDLKFRATSAQTLSVARLFLTIVHSPLFCSGVYSAILLAHTSICTLNPVVIARLQRPYTALSILYERHYRPSCHAYTLKLKA